MLMEMLLKKESFAAHLLVKSVNFVVYVVNIVTMPLQQQRSEEHASELQSL